MPISAYLAGLRASVGHALVLMPCACAVVRDGSGAILLHKRADDGLWALPGGALDPDEQPARACVREVYEETGLIVRPRRILAVETHPVTRYPNGDLAQPVVTVFACDVIGGHLESRDGESTDIGFFPPDRFPRSHLLTRMQPDVFMATPTAVFAWDDAWLAEVTDEDAGRLPIG